MLWKCKSVDINFINVTRWSISVKNFTKKIGGDKGNIKWKTEDYRIFLGISLIKLY